MTRRENLRKNEPFMTKVKIANPDEDGWPIECYGVIDTGAARTSIDMGLAIALNLEGAGRVKVRSANGVQRRSLVWLEIEVFGEVLTLKASTTTRSKLSCPILIGRDILHNAYKEEE